ncbi:MAG: hypothetical protein ACNS62_07005 [Candidatus Cyclobacteriaceae bacterium M3_2C_046]
MSDHSMTAEIKQEQQILSGIRKMEQEALKGRKSITRGAALGNKTKINRRRQPSTISSKARCAS